MRRNRSLLDCKKGQWLQLTFVLVILVVFGVVGLVLTNFTSDINDAIQGEADMSNESTEMMAAQNTATPNFLDGAISIVLLGAFLLSVGLAYQSGGSPMLLVVAILVIVSLGFAGMIFSNVWDELAGDSEFSGFRTQLPMTNFFLNNYLSIVVVMGVSTLVIGLSRGGAF